MLWLSQIIRYIEMAGKRVIVINQRVRFKDKVPSILSSCVSVEEVQGKSNELIRLENMGRAGRVTELLVNKIKLIDMILLQCPSSVCGMLNKQKNILYLDDAHFSIEGIDWVGRKLKKSYPYLFAEKSRL